MSCCCCMTDGGLLLDADVKSVIHSCQRVSCGSKAAPCPCPCPATGIRREEEEEDYRRRKMDVVLLTEEYRSSRERRRAQVLLLRTGSEELSEAVRIVPVAQVTSPCEPNMPLPPTFESSPAMYDPWHVHLDLHRRSRPTMSTHLPPLSSETSTSRRSWSLSSEAGGRRPPTSDSLCSSRETLPCVSLTRDEDHVSADGSADSSGSSDGSSGASFRTCSHDQVQSSPEQHVSEAADNLSRMSTVSSVTGSQESDNLSSTPVSSCTTSQLPAPTPVSMFSRRLSAGGVCSSSQNHFPFPNRKTPKISEAARKLGMYSSF